MDVFFYLLLAGGVTYAMVIALRAIRDADSRQQVRDKFEEITKNWGGGGEE